MSYLTHWRWKAIYDTGEEFKEGEENPFYTPEQPPEKKLLSISHLDANKVKELHLYHFSGESEILLIQEVKKMLKNGKTPSEHHGVLETLASRFPDEMVIHKNIPKAVLKVNLNEGERFIKFWRRFMGIKLNIGTGVNNGACEVLGIQKTVGGKNVKFFVYLNDSGEILISTNDKEI